MNGGNSKACNDDAVKKHNHRRHPSKQRRGKETKEDKPWKQDKEKVKVKKVQRKSDDGSSGTLFTPIKNPPTSTKTSSGEQERTQLRKKLQLINKCLECLKKQKWKVMQQLKEMDDSDSDD